MSDLISGDVYRGCLNCAYCRDKAEFNSGEIFCKTRGARRDVENECNEFWDGAGQGWWDRETKPLSVLLTDNTVIIIDGKTRRATLEIRNDL